MFFATKASFASECSRPQALASALIMSAPTSKKSSTTKNAKITAIKLYRKLLESIE